MKNLNKKEGYIVLYQSPYRHTDHAAFPDSSGTSADYNGGHGDYRAAAGIDYPVDFRGYDVADLSGHHFVRASRPGRLPCIMADQRNLRSGTAILW